MTGFGLNATMLMIDPPTELYFPTAEVVESGSGTIALMVWAAMILIPVSLVIWIRVSKYHRTDPRELAMQSLAKKLGLSSAQVGSICSLAEREGTHPVGLMMSPSAVRNAAGN